MKYYILDDSGNKEGPFDLLAIIRKIRGGTLFPDTMLSVGESGKPQAAIEVPKLADVFHEKEESDANAQSFAFRQQSLSSSLRSGWMFFQSNQISTVYTGVFILSLIVVTSLFHFATSGFLRFPAYMMAMIFGFFGLSVYLFFILRMNRGQPTELDYMKNTILGCFKPLLMGSCCIAVAAFFGFLLIIPGLFIFTIYIFAPLLIIDHKMEFWDAMETSRKLVMGSGVDNMGIIFALVVINFIGGLLVFLPLLFTLPVTMSALCDMYDEQFNN